MMENIKSTCTTTCGDKKVVESTKYRLALNEVPGDRESLKLLATGGASSLHADVAVLAVSALPDELEKSLSQDGQLRELALLVHALHVEQLIVCVSKMDATPVAHSESVFAETKKSVGGILRALGFSAEVPFIPVTSDAGDSVSAHSSKMGWFKGPTLLEALDSLSAPQRSLSAPLRVSVREVYHLENIGAVVDGRVEAGTLQLGAKIAFAPGGANGKVKTVEVECETVREAYPLDNVSFAIEGLSVGDLRRGMIASEAPSGQGTAKEDTGAVEAETFLAHVVVLKGPGEIRVGCAPVLVCHAAQVPCCFEELLARCDRRTGAEVEKKPGALRAGDAGLVKIRPEQPVCVEPYSQCPRLGHFATAKEQTAITLVGVVHEVYARAAPA
eukprot:gnl/TRDRNA2_/TRDRNA2_89056_c0_seq1.p1 gnl/TRDRNA2_/TRDRNA2_89056_c0~~gnl/TRDRNA2_/TRDRNA2_89056_c0_seq1.p1  ORF type:complete len:395 (+),score=85.00 gnl/TRDRNA2_/TRDRNA2_89056_c0_seq1:26-1186(+)